MPTVFLYQQTGIGYIKQGPPVTRAKMEQITTPEGKNQVFTTLFEGGGSGPLGNRYYFSLIQVYTGTDYGTVRFSDLTGRTDGTPNSQRDWNVHTEETISSLII